MTVLSLWRYPVKSLGGESIPEAVLTPLGIHGDRVVHVRGPEGVRTSRRHYRLLGMRGTLGPDGVPQIDGLPWRHPDSLARVREAAGSDAWLEDEGPARFDVLPLLVATDGAVSAFGRDVRRLRPNILIGGVDGLAEFEWEGAELHIGDAVIGLDSRRGRCPMTTVDPDTLERDPEVLRDIGRRFGGRLALNAEVLVPGRIRVGNEVRLVVPEAIRVLLAGTSSGSAPTRGCLRLLCHNAPMRFLALALGVVTLGLAQAPDVGWPKHGGEHNIRHSPLSQINRTNVAQLRVAWTYDSKDSFPGSEMQSHPVIVDGTAYVTTPSMKVAAVDARTGKERWTFALAPAEAPRTRFRHRGVTVHQDRVFVTYRNFVYALDRSTGRPIPGFGTGGRVDLREGLGLPMEQATVSASTPGAVFEDVIVFGSSVPETLPGTPGHIRAFDVKTGRLRWIFHTVPQPGELGSDTWPKGPTLSGGANAWAGITVDERNAMVFAATGSASFDWYGVNRHGDNLFADSVVALDARTGKHVWHYQVIKHDLWDWDLPAAPSLVTVTRDGRPTEAVAQITKHGYVFVLDRRTGASLFPVEERPASASTVDGERAAVTQRHPLAPPPFVRQELTEAMLTRRTPEAHAAVLAEFRRYRSGPLFTPPSPDGLIVFPGVDGGAEWGGAAFDPDTGLLYVNANEMPWLMRLIPNTDAALYGSKCASCHRSDRTGGPQAPSLVDIGTRMTRDQIAGVIRQGTGRMPGFPDMGAKNIGDVVEFLVTGKDQANDPAIANDPNRLKYRNDGEVLWRDPDGYPPIVPPWGTLSAIDLNAGTMRWQKPLGEYPELVSKGLRDTGSDNYGGPIVTAGGLLFIAATNFDRKFRAFDKLTGALLWETTLPFAGSATPSTYTVGGKQFVLIACGGGKNGAPSGSTLVAFALP